MNKMKHTLRYVVALLLASLTWLAAGAAEKKAMPKEDVVEVPAIGPSLCVANVFQSNMVLQRDKPLNIWGWADRGEEVTVSFAGQQAAAKAAADRSWQVTLKPVPARNTPQAMTVKGKSTTLTLENILVGDVWILGGQEQHGISHQRSGRRRAGNRLGQLPANPASDHAGREGLCLRAELRASARVERLVLGALSQRRLGHLFA